MALSLSPVRLGFLAVALVLTPASISPAMTAGSSTPVETTAMPEYKAADELIKNEKYAEAITALNAMKKPDDANVLNLLGYAHRKMGKVDEGISYYLKGLQIDAKHKGIHEYLGEAYLMKKELAKAEETAVKLKALCGETECAEYNELSTAIEKYKKTEGS